jgi:hypothetical protein
MDTTSYEIIDGLKSKRASVKLLKMSDGSYGVEVKKYFFGFCYSSFRELFDTHEQAEDVYVRYKDMVKTGQTDFD